MRFAISPRTPRDVPDSNELCGRASEPGRLLPSKVSGLRPGPRGQGVINPDSGDPPPRSASSIIALIKENRDLMASASGIPRNYHEIFDPKVRGFSWTLPIVLFVALMLSTQTDLLYDFGPKREISWLKIWLDTFPYSQLGQVFSTAISACALVWLSFQLKSVWQIGIVFGAADGAR